MTFDQIRNVFQRSVLALYKDAIQFVLCFVWINSNEVPLFSNDMSSIDSRDILEFG